MKLFQCPHGKFTIFFIEAYNQILNAPSLTPIGAWAIVESQDQVLIIKESKSKTSYYAKQDIGFILHTAKYGQHYEVSNNQYNIIFGMDNWEKKWMEFKEYQLWKKDRQVIKLKIASTLQNESWKSTGQL